MRSKKIPRSLSLQQIPITCCFNGNIVAYFNISVLFCTQKKLLRSLKSADHLEVINCLKKLSHRICHCSAPANHQLSHRQNMGGWDGRMGSCKTSGFHGHHMENIRSYIHCRKRSQSIPKFGSFLALPCDVNSEPQMVHEWARGQVLRRDQLPEQ